MEQVRRIFGVIRALGSRNSVMTERSPSPFFFSHGCNLGRPIITEANGNRSHDFRGIRDVAKVII